MCTPTQGVWQPAGCVSCEPVCVCVSLVRVVIICPASTHTALVSSPSLAVLHLSTYLPTSSSCNKLSHAQHLDEVTWTTKNWHGLQMQRLSVVLHTAVAWQTVNELACGESGIVHGAECIAVLNGVA